MSLLLNKFGSTNTIPSNAVVSPSLVSSEMTILSLVPVVALNYNESLEDFSFLPSS